MVRSCLLITLTKCPKGHQSLGSLCSVVKTLIVCGNRQTNQGTRSPIELFWTAKKEGRTSSPDKLFCVVFVDKQSRSCIFKYHETQHNEIYDVHYFFTFTFSLLKRLSIDWPMKSLLLSPNPCLSISFSSSLVKPEYYSLQETVI